MYVLVSEKPMAWLVNGLEDSAGALKDGDTDSCIDLTRMDNCSEVSQVKIISLCTQNEDIK